jgi:predicted MPP superfamily phosphohydrolase
MVVAVSGGALLAVATAARIYRGGTTLNDHAVAMVVTGCVGVYPTLWIAAAQAGVSGLPLALLGLILALAAGSLYGLFHVLDGRRDPGAAMWVAHLSQPAYAFSLWCGLLLLLRAPVAVLLGAPLAWPGWLLLLPLGLAMWGWAWTHLGHRVRTHRVDITGLPGEVRIAHLSDLHASPTMRAQDLQAVVRETNALRPDLVVVTGDLVMPFSEAEHGFLIEALASVDAPTFVCLGNHDLPVAERLQAELAAVGVVTLVDASVTVQVGATRVEIAGVNFHWRDARGALLAAIDRLPTPSAEARVLLAHDPRLFSWTPEARFDLVLSGHTHGGQVGTDMFGVPWSVLRLLGVRDQGAWSRGRSRLWVHRGNWHTGLPPRMGIATEIVVHTLVPAGA